MLSTPQIIRKLTGKNPKHLKGGRSMPELTKQEDLKNYILEGLRNPKTANQRRLEQKGKIGKQEIKEEKIPTPPPIARSPPTPLYPRYIPPTPNIPIAPPLPSANIPIAPPLPSSNIPIAPPLPSSNIPIAPPLPSSNIPIAPPLPEEVKEVIAEMPIKKVEELNKKLEFLDEIRKGIELKATPKDVEKFETEENKFLSELKKQIVKPALKKASERKLNEKPLKPRELSQREKVIQELQSRVKKGLDEEKASALRASGLSGGKFWKKGNLFCFTAKRGRVVCVPPSRFKPYQEGKKGRTIPKTEPVRLGDMNVRQLRAVIKAYKDKNCPPYAKLKKQELLQLAKDITDKKIVLSEEGIKRRKAEQQTIERKRLQAEQTSQTAKLIKQAQEKEEKAYLKRIEQSRKQKEKEQKEIEKEKKKQEAKQAKEEKKAETKRLQELKRIEKEKKKAVDKVKSDIEKAKSEGEKRIMKYALDKEKRELKEIKEQVQIAKEAEKEAKEAEKEANIQLEIIKEEIKEIKEPEPPIIEEKKEEEKKEEEKKEEEEEDECEKLFDTNPDLERLLGDIGQYEDAIKKWHNTSGLPQSRFDIENIISVYMNYMSILGLNNSLLTEIAKLGNEECLDIQLGDTLTDFYKIANFLETLDNTPLFHNKLILDKYTTEGIRDHYRRFITRDFQDLREFMEKNNYEEDEELKNIILRLTNKNNLYDQLKQSREYLEGKRKALLLIDRIFKYKAYLIKKFESPEYNPPEQQQEEQKEEQKEEQQEEQKEELQEEQKEEPISEEKAEELEDVVENPEELEDFYNTYKLKNKIPTRESLSKLKNLTTEQTYLDVKNDLESVQNFGNFFPTPLSCLDSQVVKNVIKGAEYILEPTAGLGNLIYKVYKENPDAKITGYDLNPNFVAFMEDQFPEAELEHTNFLTTTSDNNYFDLIICNPPFTSSQGDKQYYLDFLFKCFRYLRDYGGKARPELIFIAPELTEEKQSYDSMLEKGLEPIINLEKLRNLSKKKKQELYNKYNDLGVSLTLRDDEDWQEFLEGIIPYQMSVIQQCKFTTTGTKIYVYVAFGYVSGSGISGGCMSCCSRNSRCGCCKGRNRCYWDDYEDFEGGTLDINDNFHSVYMNRSDYH